jgi:hypothetical protein
MQPQDHHIGIMLFRWTLAWHTARRFHHATPFQADSDWDEDRTWRRHNKRSIFNQGDFFGWFGGSSRDFDKDGSYDSAGGSSRDFDKDESYDSAEEFPMPANTVPHVMTIRKLPMNA